MKGGKKLGMKGGWGVMVGDGAYWCAPRRGLRAGGDEGMGRVGVRPGVGLRVGLGWGYSAVRPPSITSSEPVMKEASSEARNRTP